MTDLIELANPQPTIPVGRYLKARRRWVAAGKPLRSDAEIQRIHEEMCKPCEHYIKQTEHTGRCRLCTCQLNLGKEFNKIAWATEGCPKKPPLWEADVTVDVEGSSL